MLIYLGFKVLKPLLQLLDGLTLEAVGCLQLPNTLRYTALVPSKGFRTEVGVTFLRACPIFFVTSCFDAFRFGLAVQRIARTMRDKNEHHLPNRLQSYKMSVQLLWTDFGKMKKNIFFAQNSPFWSNFLSESGVIDTRNDLLREFFAPNVQSIEGIRAICAVFEKIFFGLRKFLAGLVFVEAISSVYDAGRLNCEQQIIVVLTVKKWHQSLLSLEGLVD